MQPFIVSVSTGSSTSARAASQQMDEGVVRDTVRQLASLYYKQVQAVCKHRASQAGIEQTRSGLLNSQSQVQIKIERLVRSLRECEEARQQVNQLESERDALGVQLENLKGEMLQAKSELQPLQARIKQQQAKAEPLTTEIERLEKQLKSLNQLKGLSEGSIDCSPLLEQLQQFFSAIKDLDALESSSFSDIWAAEAKTPGMARFANDAALNLVNSLRQTSSEMMKCDSLDQFEAIFQRAQADCLKALEIDFQRQSMIVNGKGNIAHVATLMLAVCLMLRLASNAFQANSSNRASSLADVVLGFVMVASYAIACTALNNKIREEQNAWSAFSSRITQRAKNEFDRTGSQLTSQRARLPELGQALYREWRASRAAETGQRVPEGIQSFLKHCAEQAPSRMLSTMRQQKLKELNLRDLDAVASAFSDLTSRLNNRRTAHANVSEQTRQLRLQHKQRKDQIADLANSLKYGAGKKLAEDLAAINRKLKQKRMQNVDPTALDELKATQQNLTHQISLLDIQASNMQQAFQAQLAEIANEVARRPLSDSVVKEVRRQFCQKLNWSEHHLQVMWNRHVSLGPQQLRARINGQDSVGSLGGPVPGLNAGQNASSYATPALALKALFDVADAIGTIDLAHESVREVVEHHLPVGMIAVAPQGDISTVSGTLVEIMPATVERPRIVHLTPVTATRSSSLTDDEAELLHRLSA